MLYKDEVILSDPATVDRVVVVVGGGGGGVSAAAGDVYVAALRPTPAHNQRTAEKDHWLPYY